MGSVLADRLVELIEGQVAWVITARRPVLRPLLLSYDLLLELKLLLHLVYVSQLLNHLLVLHFIAIVPSFLTSTRLSWALSGLGIHLAS